jgi:valyl-tRNA synthetase
VFLNVGEALIIAQWPSEGLMVEEGALSEFNALKGIVKAVRNARAEYGVEEKRRVAATLVVADIALRQQLMAEIQVTTEMAGQEWTP